MMTVRYPPLNAMQISSVAGQSQTWPGIALNRDNGRLARLGVARHGWSLVPSLAPGTRLASPMFVGSNPLWHGLLASRLGPTSGLWLQFWLFMFPLIGFTQ
jgi:hypothetical protein